MATGGVPHNNEPSYYGDDLDSRFAQRHCRTRMSQLSFLTLVDLERVFANPGQLARLLLPLRNASDQLVQSRKQKLQDGRFVRLFVAENIKTKQTDCEDKFNEANETGRK